MGIWASEISKQSGLTIKSLANLLPVRPLLRKSGLLLVVAAGLLLATPMIRYGYPDPTHDGRFHISHLECFSRQFWGGELYPRWFPTPNNGFGSPSLFYNPPLPCYVGTLFWRFAPLGGEAGFALAWTTSFALILSGVGALCCLRRFVVNEWAAVVGAVVYMAVPYHYAIDLLARGANSEFWAFVWMPLIISALEDLSRTLKRTNQLQDGKHNGTTNLSWAQAGVPETLKLTLWIACLFFTHVITAVTFAPVAAGFALFRGWRTFKRLLTAGLVAVGLSAIYLLPLYAYGSIIRASDWLWTNGEDISRSVFFPSLEWSKPIMLSAMPDDIFANRLLHIFFGFVLVYAIAILAVCNLKFDRRARTNVIFWILVLGGCVATMLPISLPIYHYISLLRHIQFSWRFMSCATLAQSLLVALLLDAFWRKEARVLLSDPQLWCAHVSTLVVLEVTLYLTFTLDIATYREGFFDNGKLRLAPPSTDVFALDSHGELVPISANEEEAQHLFPNSINSSSTTPDPKLLEGAGRVAGTPKSARHWTLDIQATSPCRVVVPQYWFPGWKA
ncbi:MAG: hypothetical protein ABSH15_04160, partial [Verrucomicrobiota bacterium]